MTPAATPSDSIVLPLHEAAALDVRKILNPARLAGDGGIAGDTPVLVVLAAGKGTRFGQEPKCIQPVHGTPLARHSIDAFLRISPSPAICLIGYRHLDVAAALGPDPIYVVSAAPAGGTAFAAFEAFSVPGVLDHNPLLIITMGDRIVPSSVFRRLCETHHADGREADLTFLSAVYQPPRNAGKGRVLRDAQDHVLRIIEERDILAESDETARRALLNLTEGNCPLYAIRAATLHRHLRGLTNANAQNQYYLTDIIQTISRAGGDIRTITTTVADPEYDLLCSDVTKPMDLALLEGTLDSSRALMFPEEAEVRETAAALTSGRPPAQVASVARQLEEIVAAARQEKLGFAPDQPVGIGIAGGRLRIAFMHPDMARFFGPAWQMPIGAGSEHGREQIVILTQGADDRRIHLYPLNPSFRENVNSIPSDTETMYPGEEISDLHTYEVFGTRMSERLLLSLGYFSDEELDQRRRKNLPLPPPSLWVASNMRRPFALVGNAIASLRTLRAGNLGAKVQAVLGREAFLGLRLASTGNIPQGGFSSSSAVTVATKNAINSLFRLGIPADLLVHLACQAEYGTGVRAGSLDQATEQKGLAGRGTLISSNPADNYRILGTYPVPADRFQILFPFSVERDRASWMWSAGAYAELAVPGRPLTTGETRKMTGKAAEIAALLTGQPPDTDFFKVIEADLVADGALSLDNRAWIAALLRRIPLRVTHAELRQQLQACRETCIRQLMEAGLGDAEAAGRKADATLSGLLAGWREPLCRRTLPDGTVVRETGVPLRAMVAYLFGEVAKNFHLIHHPGEWIETVTRSQTGDRCMDIDPDRLPEAELMEREFDWEREATGPARLDLWLARHGATPVDYNRGLDDATLSAATPPDFRLLEGSSFFRGLALIDLAEAMLKRAFGREATAVRVNAAGQGDYFQVHVDLRKAAPAEVKRFLRAAFYRRFGLAPTPEFVEVHPGGGAAGVRLSRFDYLPQLIQKLKTAPPG
jgi:hypothetical protein